jgi:alkylation response protein AidB-like acyl-CoA dehydrogenase
MTLHVPRLQPVRASPQSPRSAGGFLGDLAATLVRLADDFALADRDGVFPSGAVAALKRCGALSAFAPPSAGGIAFDDRAQYVETLFNSLRLVGRADLSLGRIFEGHVNGVKLIEWYGDAQQNALMAADLQLGGLFGVWATEPKPGVALVEGNGRTSLIGAKSFATGAGFVRRAIVTAGIAGGGRQMVMIRGDEKDRADASGWRVRGMRATQSGLYTVSNMAAPPTALLGQPGDYEREPRFTGGAWRFTAVQLGGIERVVTLLRDALRAGGADQDPVQRAQFGDAVAPARSAWLWVRKAASAVEALEPDAATIVLMTRGVVERAALDVMEIAQRGAGTRAFSADSALDRVLRDLGLYLRQAGPYQARDRAVQSWLERDPWGESAWW